HALQNLITNAAKYGADGLNWIGVTARRVTLKDHAGVEIRVSDKGPGIPEAEQGNIFDPFYRGKRALRDQIQGTGLGLSLVKGIVEAHGGSISVESEPAKGTHFIIRLPAPDAPEHQNELTDSLSRG
ncbi:MAG: ATP-binding protein, partial [Bryobacterales bacterium]|nr:ATP-binding protein [Bryobacterales bacterium]